MIKKWINKTNWIHSDKLSWKFVWVNSIKLRCGRKYYPKITVICRGYRCLISDTKNFAIGNKGCKHLFDLFFFFFFLPKKKNAESR